MSDKRPRGDRIFELYQGGPNVGHLTEEVIRHALAGLGVQPKVPGDELANSIRRAVYFGCRFANSRDGQKGNAEVRDELASLAERARNLWGDLFERSNEADSAIWDFAWRRWIDRADGEIGDPAEHRLFLDALGRLEWMASFLQHAAIDVGSQIETPRWVDAERKRLRVWLARCLSVAFEEGYNKKATPKNGGSNNDPASFGPWGDFYCRILDAAKIDGARYNLGDVLKQARTLHLREPVVFAPEFLAN